MYETKHSISGRLAEIEILDLSSEEMELLLGHKDMLIRIDLLLGIKRGIEFSAPNHPSALKHFFTQPNSIEAFNSVSVKEFLLSGDLESTQRLEKVHRFYMSKSC